MEIEEHLKDTINKVETELHAAHVQEQEKEESEEEHGDQMKIEENVVEHTPNVADDKSVSSPKTEQVFEPNRQKQLSISNDEE